MKSFLSRLCLLFLLFAVLPAAWAEDAPPRIRSFPLETIESLGRDLHRCEQVRMAAFSAHFKRLPKLHELVKIEGGQNRMDFQLVAGETSWTTELSPGFARVYIVMKTKDSPATSVLVTVPADRSEPKVMPLGTAPLPEPIAKRFAARETAIAALPNVPAESSGYEVLDDPDGSGFLVYDVYSLTSDEGPIGSHRNYRVTVAAEGTVEQVDVISQRPFSFQKPPADLSEKSIPPSWISHRLSDLPVETYVADTLRWDGLSVGVLTLSDRLWKIERGKITELKAQKQ